MCILNKASSRCKTGSQPVQLFLSYDIHYSHCLLDGLFQAQKHKDTLMEYLQKVHRFICTYFPKYVTVFCDLQYLQQNPNLVTILDEAGSFGSIGCHSKKARVWSPKIAAIMLHHLKHHSKMVAVLEMGLDFSWKTSEKEAVFKAHCNPCQRCHDPLPQDC